MKFSFSVLVEFSPHCILQCSYIIITELNVITSFFEPHVGSYFLATAWTIPFSYNKLHTSSIED